MGVFPRNVSVFSSRRVYVFRSREVSIFSSRKVYMSVTKGTLKLSLLRSRQVTMCVFRGLNTTGSRQVNMVRS